MNLTLESETSRNISFAVVTVPRCHPLLFFSPIKGEKVWCICFPDVGCLSKTPLPWCLPASLPHAVRGWQALILQEVGERIKVRWIVFSLYGLICTPLERRLVKGDPSGKRSLLETISTIAKVRLYLIQNVLDSTEKIIDNLCSSVVK